MSTSTAQSAEGPVSSVVMTKLPPVGSAEEIRVLGERITALKLSCMRLHKKNFPQSTMSLSTWGVKELDTALPLEVAVNSFFIHELSTPNHRDILRKSATILLETFAIDEVVCDLLKRLLVEEPVADEIR